MTRTHDRETSTHRDDTDVVETETVETDEAYEKFGGGNAGAAFFGWVVAVGVAVLLTGLVGAVAAAIGDAQEITQSDAERDAGTIGIAAAIALIAVLMVAYYAGGYVAGRMSRFDGARQGVLAWALGVVITVVALAAGWVFGDQYNVFDRVDLPRIPIPTDDMTTGGVVTGVLVLVGTLIAAAAGGKVGRHYHARVDRYVERSEVADRG
jgi:amino acid transporter